MGIEEIINYKVHSAKHGLSVFKQRFKQYLNAVSYTHLDVYKRQDVLQLKVSEDVQRDIETIISFLIRCV